MLLKKDLNVKTSTPHPPSAAFQLFPSPSPAIFSLSAELPKSGNFLLFCCLKGRQTVRRGQWTVGRCIKSPSGPKVLQSVPAVLLEPGQPVCPWLTWLWAWRVSSVMSWSPGAVAWGVTLLPSSKWEACRHKPGRVARPSFVTVPQGSAQPKLPCS